MKTHHCRWEHTPRDMAAGTAGKRTHSPKLCDACRAGKNAYDMPHSTVIRSRSLQAVMSSPHDIPWLDNERPEWRDYAEGLAV